MPRLQKQAGQVLGGGKGGLHAGFGMGSRDCTVTRPKEWDKDKGAAVGGFQKQNNQR